MKRIGRLGHSSPCAANDGRSSAAAATAIAVAATNAAFARAFVMPNESLGKSTLASLEVHRISSLPASNRRSDPLDAILHLLARAHGLRDARSAGAIRRRLLPGDDHDL